MDESELSRNPSLSQLLNILHHSNKFAYATLSPAYRVEYVSPNLPTILQQDGLDALIGRPVFELFGELLGAEAGMQEVLAGRAPVYQLENVARSLPDQTLAYFTLRLSPLKMDDPAAGLLAYVEDTTAVARLQQRLTQQRNDLKLEVARRQKAEAALQALNNQLEQRVRQRTAELEKANEQLRLLEAAIVNTSDTVIITEAEPNDLSQAGIVYVNKAFTRATGYTYKEIVGQSQQVFHGPNTDPRQLERIRRALLNKEAVHVELINYRKDGTEFWADMTVAPILNENKELTHFVSIERDATERKQLETALLQAQKMEAVGLLAGGIAHDFNNVLTIVMSYSDLLLRLFADNDKVVKYAEPIQMAGKRASDLTYQLLAFSRQQVLQMEPVQLNDVVQEVKMMIGRPIGEDIEFVTELTPDLWQFEADPGQISQVVLNLAMNARDAMPQGGRLMIRTENVVLENADGRISPELEAGEYVRLTVQDTGSGMDAETVKRIFDPFFTTKAQGKGTGLGLSTVYGIVAQSKGGVLVQSELSAGTRFEIYMPRIEGASAAQQNTAGQAAAPKEQGGTILLVEDDDSVRNLVREGLTAQGYTLLVAGSGVEALEICQQYSRQIDLLLTDIVMPGMSGPELAEKLYEIFPSAKMLFMTGYTDTVIARHGALNQPVEIIQKPFTIEQLGQKVLQVLHAHNPL